MKNNIHKINGYIYITSEETPKLYEYGINIKNNVIFKDEGFEDDEYSINYCRKIIITNDPNLTAIQQLTPEQVSYLNSVDSCEVQDLVDFYKIFIPTEQQKEMSLEEVLPDLSNLSKEEKDKALTGFMQESGKYLIAYMKMFGLKTHIESNIVNGSERYVFIFRTKEYHASKTLYTESDMIELFDEYNHYLINNREDVVCFELWFNQNKKQ